MMTNAQLRQVMRYYLNQFDRTPAPVTDDTIHQDLLAADDGYGPANSARLYESFVRYSLTTAGNPLAPWPSNWLELTIGALADRLVPAVAPSAPPAPPAGAKRRLEREA